MGHVTHKTVSEITYDVSSGTLNATLPYQSPSHVVWSRDLKCYKEIAGYSKLMNVRLDGTNF